MKRPQCSKCHRPLKDPFSIAIGMGPECRGKLGRKGWKFPKPKWRVSHGHVELLGVTGRIIEPPAVHVESDEQSTVKRQRKSNEWKERLNESHH